MGLIGLAILGILVGAAGTEILRTKKPELVEEVEDRVGRFANRLCVWKSADANAKEKEK